MPFQAFNVDEDDRAYDDLLARGFRSVPITIAGDRVVRGFDVPALDAIVAAERGAAEPPAQ